MRTYEGLAGVGDRLVELGRRVLRRDGVRDHSVRVPRVQDPPHRRRRDLFQRDAPGGGGGDAGELGEGAGAGGCGGDGVGGQVDRPLVVAVAEAPRVLPLRVDPATPLRRALRAKRHRGRVEVGNGLAAARHEARELLEGEEVGRLLGCVRRHVVAEDQHRHRRPRVRDVDGLISRIPVSPDCAAGGGRGVLQPHEGVAPAQALGQVCGVARDLVCAQQHAREVAVLRKVGWGQGMRAGGQGCVHAR